MLDAAIYCRISRDAEGKELGVARQEVACRELAEREGFTVVDVYIDNDIGASTASRRKARPEYARLLDDAEAGRVGVILAYSNSRLTRRPAEWITLINLANAGRLRIKTVASGEHDLSTADGRAVALTIAAWDAAEAERTAERVTSKHLELAQAGRAVGGRRPFGYHDDKITIRETEAALIREAVADVLDGVRLVTIAERWNTAGVQTVTGSSPWTGGKLLQLLRSPRLAGWRVHRPKGTTWAPVPSIALDKQGEPVRGEWEPIIDDATHRAVVARLTGKVDRRKVVPRRNARRFLMTGLLHCAECGGRMYANKQGENHYYRCDGCTNSASGRGVDGWIAEQVIERSELLAANVAPSGPTTSDRLRELNEQIGAMDELIEDIMSAYRAKQVPGRVAFANASRLEESRDAVLAERDALEIELAATNAEAVSAVTWEAMDTDRRRAACERVLTAVYAKRAASPTGNRFDTGRLDPIWK